MIDPIAQEKQAWDEYEELRQLIKNDIRSFLRKGQLLKNLRDTERYKKLGDGGYETFNSFLNDPVLKISRGYAYQQIQMFDFYVEELHLPVEEIEDIASIKLMIHCANYINTHNLNNEQALEIIEKAKVLSYTDFFREMEELPGGNVVEGQIAASPAQLPSAEQREIDSYRKPHIERCEMCNKSRVEYFKDQICDCDGTFHLVEKSLEHTDYNAENAGEEDEQNG